MPNQHPGRLARRESAEELIACLRDAQRAARTAGLDPADITQIGDLLQRARRHRGHMPGGLAAGLPLDTTRSRSAPLALAA